VARGEDEARQDGCKPLPPDKGKHAIVYQRVQEHLLEQAEGEVPPEAMPGDQIWRQVQWRPEPNSDCNQTHCHRAENEHGLTRRRPKIVCAPAERLWRVAMQGEAENHPTDEDYPRPARRKLQLPDEAKNERGQKGDVGDRKVTEGARVHF
jgi:hypothetical protein